MHYRKDVSHRPPGSRTAASCICTCGRLRRPYLYLQVATELYLYLYPHTYLQRRIKYYATHLDVPWELR